MRLTLRTWNLFHGNTLPPQRHAYLDEMVRRIAVGDPDVVCLQELPVWALRRLEQWSGMQGLGEVAARPHLGPFPSSAELGRVVTEVHHGVLRSTFTGQANALLVSPRVRVLGRDRIVLNAKRFRDAQARGLALGPVARLAWAKERRVAQGARLQLDDGATVVVVNLHATSFRADPRLADAELIRAATFLEALAGPTEPCVLAGDFNVRAASSRALPELAQWGFSGDGRDVDHVLVRNGSLGPLVRWPDDRRRLDGRLLSDHVPLEVTIA